MIQKCLSSFDDGQRDFIFNALVKHSRQIATHKQGMYKFNIQFAFIKSIPFCLFQFVYNFSGCCVIQKCLESGSPHQIVHCHVARVFIMFR